MIVSVATVVDSLSANYSVCISRISLLPVLLLMHTVPNANAGQSTEVSNDKTL